MQELDGPPLKIVLVRHAESVGNVAVKAAKNGDPSHYTEKFKNTHSSEWDITPKGIEQAIRTGEWIRENIDNGIFDGYYVSTYRRAKKTAGYFHLPESEETDLWVPRDYLREHDWGILDVMTEEEKWEKYPDIMKKKDIDPFYFPFLSGESMANLTLRFRIGFLNMVYREHAGEKVIAVTHGNTMWAARYILEGMTPEIFKQLDASDDPLKK